MHPHEAYLELIDRARELATLGSCSSLLGWDEQTFMPPGGAGHRSAQMGLLAGIHHERATNPRIGELLAIVEGSDLVSDPGSLAAVNTRELRRTYDRRTRLPRTLVEELARTISLSQPEWVAARAASNFARFHPWLEKIIQLKRHESACISRVAAPSPADAVAVAPQSKIQNLKPKIELYDSLLDEYEPGANAADLADLFQALRRNLVPLTARIAEAAHRKESASPAMSGPAHDSSNFGKPAILTRHYPRDRQKIFGEAVAAAIGFDFNRGRLDVTAHPFCSGIGPGDCRITTRYDERNFSEAFFGILHEVGHGLYEQGLDPDHYGTPMGEAVSLGVHESQSRLWENAVARSRPFWSYWFPMAQRIFPAALAGVTLDDFHAAVNHVAPSLIRVQADEVTYNLHIIVRFELEQALLSGDLPTTELPTAWNQKYEDVLGLKPGNDAEGCLQDIHWSAGLIGYFPTYTLGNLYAAQFFARHSPNQAGLRKPSPQVTTAAFSPGSAPGSIPRASAIVRRN